MAEYKIPQNVETEDKLLGPFSFKQFIFLIGAALGIGLAILFFRIHPALVIIPMPFIFVFLVLGLYQRPDQPVEVYLMAALNFNFKPHQRKWNPEGQHDHVIITKPKKPPAPKQKNLREEYGQLQKLARIVDTRGWSVKRPELQESYGEHSLDMDDRLGGPAIDAQTKVDQEPLDVRASDDIFDLYNNPRASDYNKLANLSRTQARDSAITKMQQASAENATNPNTVATQPAISSAATTSGSSDNANAIISLSNNNLLSVSQIAATAERQQTPVGRKINTSYGTDTTQQPTNQPAGSSAA